MLLWWSSFKIVQIFIFYVEIGCSGFRKGEIAKFHLLKLFICFQDNLSKVFLRLPFVTRLKESDLNRARTRDLLSRRRTLYRVAIKASSIARQYKYPLIQTHSYRCIVYLWDRPLYYISISRDIFKRVMRIRWLTLGRVVSVRGLEPVVLSSIPSCGAAVMVDCPLTFISPILVWLTRDNE